MEKTFTYQSDDAKTTISATVEVGGTISDEEARLRAIENVVKGSLLLITTGTPGGTPSVPDNTAPSL